MLKMDNYTFQEYVDMHLILGEARGNVAAAVRLYLEKYPRLRLAFHATDRRIMETGTVRPSTAEGGRIVDVEVPILRVIPVPVFVEYKVPNMWRAR
jgi:hypothetical protein